MSRKKTKPAQEIKPDAEYGEVMISKFINCLMLSGKKTTVENAVYKAFDNIKVKLKKNPVEVFNAAVAGVRPKVEVRSKRVGGATYQIPIEVPAKRAMALAFKWLKTAIRKRGEKSLEEKIYGELVDASEGRGWAFKKCEEVYKMAESNKAFSHLK